MINAPSYTYHSEWWLIVLIKSFIFNTAHIVIVIYVCAMNNSSRCQHAQLVHCSLYHEQSC